MRANPGRGGESPGSVDWPPEGKRVPAEMNRRRPTWAGRRGESTRFLGYGPRRFAEGQRGLVDGGESGWVAGRGGSSPAYDDWPRGRKQVEAGARQSQRWRVSQLNSSSQLSTVNLCFMKYLNNTGKENLLLDDVKNLLRRLMSRHSMTR